MFGRPLLLVIVLLATGCIGSQVRHGQEPGDNPQTRAAMQLLLIRDCRGPALASDEPETIRAYTHRELAAMKDYRDTGSELVVTGRPLDMDIAMAYARLAMLAETEGDDDAAAQWRQRARDESAETREMPQTDWESFSAYAARVDEHHRQEYQAKENTSVPSHCHDD